MGRNSEKKEFDEFRTILRAWKITKFIQYDFAMVTFKPAIVKNRPYLEGQVSEKTLFEIRFSAPVMMVIMEWFRSDALRRRRITIHWDSEQNYFSAFQLRPGSEINPVQGRELLSSPPSKTLEQQILYCAHCIARWIVEDTGYEK